MNGSSDQGHEAPSNPSSHSSGSSGESYDYNGYDSDSAELCKYFPPSTSSASLVGMPYGDIDDDEENEGAFSYFSAAAAVLADNSSRNAQGSSAAYPPPNIFNSSVTSVDLLDVPPDPEASPRAGHYKDHKTEESTTYDSKDSSQRSDSGRSNQEYYDVLEMAKSRLRTSMTTMGDAPVYDGEEHNTSSSDEGVLHNQSKKSKKSKKHKKSKKTKKEKKRKPEENIGPKHTEEKRRSAVFKTLFRDNFITRGNRPKTEDFFRASTAGDDVEMAAREEIFSIDDDDDNDEKGFDLPNDDLPPSQNTRSWNPAALVNASKSNISGGKTDQDGYYKVSTNAVSNKKEKTPLNKIKDFFGNGGAGNITYEEVENLAPKAKMQRTDSIIWADDTITDPEMDGNPSYDDDCNYSDDFKETNEHYRATASFVQRLVDRRNGRRLIAAVTAVAAFLAVCSVIYFTGEGESNGEKSQSFNSASPLKDSISRKDPPPRPTTPPPDPIDVAENNTFHKITETDLYFIVSKITEEKSVLDDSETPQSKAMEWCKNDMVNYNVEVAARVAQRYSLATLYYSTNGDGWTNSTGWLNGHECTWHGVACEPGSDGVTSITYMDLSQNELDGTLSSELGYLTTLTQLHVWGNNLFGPVPDTFSRLVNLHTLYLDKNKLDGGVRSIGGLKKLKHLDLSENNLRGEIHGLGSISTLSDLRLSQNHFSGAFPISLTSLSNLQTLLLDNNAIGGTLPSLVGSMKSIVTLRLQENDFMGNLPSFANARFLEEAHLDQVSGSISRTQMAFFSFCIFTILFLALFQNDFSGPIPEFGSKSLRDLYLGRNSLTGSIPESMGDKRELEVLSVRGNRLNESIPQTLSKATALKVLDLSFNKLSGEIPDLSKLIQLREFRLNDNHFEGPFVNFLGSFQHLEVAHLNNNLLSGALKLPIQIGDLEYLTEFSIQNNDLTGFIPEFMCDLLLDVLTSDCWGTSPPVDCPCCTICF